MHIEPDGSFEVIVSQREHPGNWLRSEPDTRSHRRSPDLSRQAAPAPCRDAHRAHRRRRHPPLTPLTPSGAHEALVIVGHYVKIVAGIGAQWAVRQAQWPNVFTDEAEDEMTDKFKDPQIKWHQAYFDLADDEALVIDVIPPACEYWMIALHNHWMETLDYVHHQVDAELPLRPPRIRRQRPVRRRPPRPRAPNWLDTAGHHRGTVGVRWVGPDIIDVLPTTRS